MKNYLTPNDEDIMDITDSKSIQNAVDNAQQQGIDNVVIPRFNRRTNKNGWSIDKTILLPSDMTIILDNCHLRLADGVFENIFRNSNTFTNLNKTSKGKQCNLRIKGIGNALLDGGESNGLIEPNSCQNGYPHIYYNHLIELHNVENAVIEDIRFTNPRHWTINLMFCRYVRLSGLHFETDESLRNRDGINLRLGCSHITIENITGRTGDDVIAITLLPLWEKYVIEDMCPDTHDVTIRNIHATTHQAVVALRNHDGAKLYNISVENVFDTGNGEDYGNPYSCIRVGENDYFTKNPSVIGETYGITVSNVFAKNNHAIAIGATLKNCVFSGIHCGGTVKNAVTTYIWSHARNGVSLENCRFEDIYVENDIENSCVAYFPAMLDTNIIKNVSFHNIFTGNAKQSELIKAANDISFES